MAKALMTVEYDIASMNSIRNLANKIDTYPNRIAAAQASAVAGGARKIESMLSSKYGSIGRAMYAKETVNRTSSRIIIDAKTPVASKRNYGRSPEWGARVRLYGRRSYKSRNYSTGTGKKYYLRPESRRTSSGMISKFKVRKMSSDAGFRLDIRMDSSKILREELVRSLRRFGFGPKGGAPRGLKDLPTPNSRARR